LNAVNLENEIINLEDDEVVPKKSKQRIRQPNEWNKNRATLLCIGGKDYTNWVGTVVEAKVMRPQCDERCRLKCQMFY
jgi:trans-2-enoyl-CoA reductase